MFYLVCFDITDNKARYKAAKFLKGYGYRVQKSVFECPTLNKSKLKKLKSHLEWIINSETDSVRFYQLCKDCLGGFASAGCNEEPRVADFFVI